MFFFRNAIRIPIRIDLTCFSMVLKSWKREDIIRIHYMGILKLSGLESGFFLVRPQKNFFWGYYVPMSQLHEYFFCSLVSVSIERPSDASLRFATCSSISFGTS